MVSFSSLAGLVSALVLASSVQAYHFLTVINGCQTRTVKPTLALSKGTFTGLKSVQLVYGQSTVFPLIASGAFTGRIYDALSGSLTKGSSLDFQFNATAANKPGYANFVIDNYNGLTVPQVAIAYPDTKACPTKQCLANSCPKTQAIAAGDKKGAAAATSHCSEANAGFTLYYCKLPTDARP